ncbi:cytosine permease, partial [Streptomyces sp. SID11233]|nr:cytosine permease [Streptomyces sp. SID11233]
LFGGDALARLLGWPFWLGVLVMMAVQGLVGALGYEAIHRLQKLMSFVLAVAFVVLAVKMLDGVSPATSGTVHGMDRFGAIMLTSTVALSLSLSWAPYASDFSRYLPAKTSRTRMFWYTLLGVSLSFVVVQTLGLWGASVFTDQTAGGVQKLLGGGWLGGFGLLA